MLKTIFALNIFIINPKIYNHESKKVFKCTAFPFVYIEWV